MNMNKFPQFEYAGEIRYALSPDGLCYEFSCSKSNENKVKFKPSPTKFRDLQSKHIVWLDDKEFSSPQFFGELVFPYAPGMVIELDDLDKSRLMQTVKVFNGLLQFTLNGEDWFRLGDSPNIPYDGSKQILFGYTGVKYTSSVKKQPMLSLELDVLTIESPGGYKNKYVLRNNEWLLPIDKVPEGKDELIKLDSKFLTHAFEVTRMSNYKFKWSRRYFYVENTPENRKAWITDYNPPFMPGMIITTDTSDKYYNRLRRTLELYPWMCYTVEEPDSSYFIITNIDDLLDGEPFDYDTQIMFVESPALRWAT